MMKHGVKQHAILAIGMTLLLMISAAHQTSAYQVTLSLYNQGFDINAFYNNGDFDVEAGIVEADPSSLLVIIGDPANVEETLEIPEIPDPFALADAGSDFHFEEFQPFRFQDRFDGLFSTTVDDPVLFVPDNGTVTAFHDDGLLADDRIDLGDYEAELPPMYVEVDYGDTITMTTYDGTKLFITRVWRNPDFTVTFDISDVPEPGTVVLLGLGLLGLFGMAWKKGKKMKIKKEFPFLLLLLLSIVIASVPDMASAQSQCAVGEKSGLDYCLVSFMEVYNSYQDELGNPIGCVEENDSGGLYQKFEKGSIESWDSGTYAVYGQFYDKWESLGWGKSDLGQPTNNVVDSWSSPQGTTGKVQFFEGGDIYLHTSGPNKGKIFFVKGAIKAVYDRNYDFGSGGWLGFPITDEYKDGTSGWSISQFEGGCITTDDGISYSERPKEECPPIPDFSASAKLIAADASCIKSGKELTQQNDHFSLKWTPYVPSGFTLSFDPSILTTSEAIELFTGIDVKTNGYGEVSTDLIVVNEGYKISFTLTKTKSGVSVSGSDGTRSYKITADKKGYKITITNGGLTCTIGPDSSSCDISLEIWGGDLRIKNFIENLKKFAKFVSALDSIDDMIEKVRKAINVFKKLPASDEICRISTGKMTYSAGYELSPLCCASSGTGIKDKHKIYGNIDADIGSVECDSPEVPIGYGFNAGVTASLDAGASVSLWGETTCGAAKICFEPEIDYSAGLGVYVSFISKKLARADLKGKVNSEATWEDLCYDFNLGLSMGQLKICARPKVVGKVTGFGFLKYEVEANIGGKVCASSGKFSGGGFGGGGGGSW